MYEAPTDYRAFRAAYGRLRFDLVGAGAERDDGTGNRYSRVSDHTAAAGTSTDPLPAVSRAAVVVTGAAAAVAIRVIDQ